MRRDLSARLASVASGHSTLRDFDRWFAVHVLGEVEGTGDKELVEAAYAIASDIATFTDGVLERDELSTRLAERSRALGTTAVRAPVSAGIATQTVSTSGQSTLRLVSRHTPVAATPTVDAPSEITAATPGG